MRRLCVPAALLWMAPFCSAQEPVSNPANIDSPQLRILRGELTQWTMRGLSGDLVVEEEGSRRWRCRVTPDTYLTRGTIRLHPAGVREGDTVEVVADFSDGSTCTAKTLYIRLADPRRLKIRQPYQYANGFLDNLFPRGVLTFAGFVSRVEGNRLFLRTRKHGDRSFAMRPDTVFSRAGQTVEQADLGVNTSVYVRASRTFEGDLEAYQVVWGGILQPGR